MLLLLFNPCGFGLDDPIFLILLVVVHLLVLDLDAYVLVEVFVLLDQVGDLTEHVRLNLHLQEFISQVFNGEVLPQLMPLFLYLVLKPRRLLSIFKVNLEAHPGAFNGNDRLQVLDEFEGLLLGGLRRVDLAVDLEHGLHDDGDGELLAVLPVDALLHYNIRDILLQVVQLVLPFQVAYLHVALVEDFVDNLLLGQVVPENL